MPRPLSDAAESRRGRMVLCIWAHHSSAVNCSKRRCLFNGDAVTVPPHGLKEKKDLRVEKRRRKEEMVGKGKRERKASTPYTISYMGKYK